MCTKTLCSLQAQLSADGFDQILNGSVLYVAVMEPVTNTDNSGVMTTLQKVGQMVIDTTPVGDVQENQPLSVQPKLNIKDAQVNQLLYLFIYACYHCLFSVNNCVGHAFIQTLCDLYPLRTMW